MSIDLDTLGALIAAGVIVTSITTTVGVLSPTVATISAAAAVIGTVGTIAGLERFRGIRR